MGRIEVNKKITGGVDLRLAGLFDDFAATWATTHHDACIAHHRGESSAEALDLRMRCLGQARLELGTLVDTLRGGGPEDLDNALVDANNLPEVRRCLDLDALSSGPPPPPPEIAAEVEQLRKQLASAALTVNRADAEAARAAIRPISDRARVLGYRPLAADALFAVGRLEAEPADYATAARDYDERRYQGIPSHAHIFTGLSDDKRASVRGASTIA